MREITQFVRTWTISGKARTIRQLCLSETPDYLSIIRSEIFFSHMEENMCHLRKLTILVAVGNRC